MLERDYYELRKKMNLEEDNSQVELVKILDNYRKKVEFNDSWYCWLRSLLFGNRFNKKNEQAGIYIWGGVGRGKTMLLDLFFNKVHSKRKKIQHFHKFMSEFHRENRISDGKFLDTGNPLTHLKLLCLDELQVNNIADAMVLHRLFSEFINNGVKIVVTSNFKPDDLFKDGLQRDRFFSFIELINDKFCVYNLNNFKDYRLSNIDKINQFYYYPLDHGSEVYLTTTLSILAEGHKLKSKRIKVSESRELEVLKSYGNLALFDFSELCELPLGADDYIAICKEFSVVILTKIPKLEQDNHNEALRFITLVDCLYESDTNLICTAEVPINDLYSGKKHSIEFRRTTSRLHEMTGKKK